jgi:hypothetical protein
VARLRGLAVIDEAVAPALDGLVRGLLVRAMAVPPPLAPHLVERGRAAYGPRYPYHALRFALAVSRPGRLLGRRRRATLLANLLGPMFGSAAAGRGFVTPGEGPYADPCSVLQDAR